MNDQRPLANALQSAPHGETHPRSPGCLFILSAPSGAGKSTLGALLRECLPALRYSVSYTTRPPRGGEKDGEDYFFIDTATFKDGIAKGRWVEWARVHGHYYGTSADYIDRLLSQGDDLLLDIDVQGAAQLVALYPDAVTIFIIPPSMEILAQRLNSRGTDSAKVIAARLENAREEMAARFGYHHIIVNDRLDQAVNELKGIINSAKRRVACEDGSMPESG